MLSIILTEKFLQSYLFLNFFFKFIFLLFSCALGNVVRYAFVRTVDNRSGKYTFYNGDKGRTRMALTNRRDEKVKKKKKKEFLSRGTPWLLPSGLCIQFHFPFQLFSSLTVHSLRIPSTLFNGRS